MVILKLSLTVIDMFAAFCFAVSGFTNGDIDFRTRRVSYLIALFLILNVVAMWGFRI